MVSMNRGGDNGQTYGDVINTRGAISIRDLIVPDDSVLQKQQPIQQSLDHVKVESTTSSSNSSQDSIQSHSYSTLQSSINDTSLESLSMRKKGYRKNLDKIVKVKAPRKKSYKKEKNYVDTPEIREKLESLINSIDEYDQSIKGSGRPRKHPLRDTLTNKKISTFPLDIQRKCHEYLRLRKLLPPTRPLGRPKKDTPDPEPLNNMRSPQQPQLQYSSVINSNDFYINQPYNVPSDQMFYGRHPSNEIHNERSSDLSEDASSPTSSLFGESDVSSVSSISESDSSLVMKTRGRTRKRQNAPFQILSRALTMPSMVEKSGRVRKENAGVVKSPKKRKSNRDVTEKVTHSDVAGNSTMNELAYRLTKNELIAMITKNKMSDKFTKNKVTGKLAKSKIAEKNKVTKSKVADKVTNIELAGKLDKSELTDKIDKSELAEKLMEIVIRYELTKDEVIDILSRNELPDEIAENEVTDQVTDKITKSKVTDKHTNIELADKQTHMITRSKATDKHTVTDLTYKLSKNQIIKLIAKSKLTDKDTENELTDILSRTDEIGEIQKKAMHLRSKNKLTDKLDNTEGMHLRSKSKLTDKGNELADKLTNTEVSDKPTKSKVAKKDTKIKKSTKGKLSGKVTKEKAKDKSSTELKSKKRGPYKKKSKNINFDVADEVGKTYSGIVNSKRISRNSNPLMNPIERVHYQIATDNELEKKLKTRFQNPNDEPVTWGLVEKDAGLSVSKPYLLLLLNPGLNDSVSL